MPAGVGRIRMSRPAWNVVTSSDARSSVRSGTKLGVWTLENASGAGGAASAVPAAALTRRPGGRHPRPVRRIRDRFSCPHASSGGILRGPQPVAPSRPGTLVALAALMSPDEEPHVRAALEFDEHADEACRRIVEG